MVFHIFCTKKFPKLYYNLEDENGKIYRYYVYEVINGSAITIPESYLRVGVYINVFYEGYYVSRQL